jgi:hypothetical protein
LRGFLRIKLRQFDAGFLREMFQSFTELHPLDALDEGKDVAADVAAETMPALPRARHVKTRRAFVMKRAIRLKCVRAGGFKGEVFPH